MNMYQCEQLARRAIPFIYDTHLVSNCFILVDPQNVLRGMSCSIHWYDVVIWSEKRIRAIARIADCRWSLMNVPLLERTRTDIVRLICDMLKCQRQPRARQGLSLGPVRS